MIKVSTLDLFGHPQLYRNMPQRVFDALYDAYVNGIDTITISEEEHGQIFGND